MWSPSVVADRIAPSGNDLQRSEPRPERSVVFNGVLAGGHSGWCVVLNDDETPRPGPGPTNPPFYIYEGCDDPFPHEGKIVSIETEMDSSTRAIGSAISRPTFGNTSWRASPIFRQTLSALR